MRGSLVPVLLLASRLASAQTPSQGMRLLAPSVVGDDDPTAVETNPGALAFSGSGLTFIVDTIENGGDAVGGFTAFRLGPLSTGLAYQSLERHGKFSTGLALRAGNTAGFGFSFHWFNSDEDGSLDDEFSVDAGYTLRPVSLLALGLAVRNLNTPRFEPTRLERVYDAELGLRPLGTDRLELGGGVRIGEDSEDIDPHFRASLSAWGVELRGDVEIADAVVGDGNDVRATAGLALNLEHAGAFGGAVISRPSRGSADASGAIVGVRMSGDRYRSLPVEPRVFEEILVDGEPEERDVVALIAHLSALERDDRTAGVLLRIGEPAVGWATVEELRAAVGRLRAAGKPVYAHLEGSTMRAYVLAAAADRVLLGPAGGVRLMGLHANLYFYKGTLDWLGVRADFLKIAEYKSAPETFTETRSTAPAREAREAILDDVYRRILGALATSRRIDTAGASARVDAGPYTAKEAVRGGLIDEIVAPEEVHDWIERRHEGVTVLPVERLAPKRSTRWGGAPRIAVVVVEGDLVDGETRNVPLFGGRMAGGDTIAQVIERAREEADAIVVRVNSPGGMVGAADRIWREIYKTRGKRPIVASLGDVAASGGYYLASAADRVFADPSTITGSIGIFFGKVDISGLLAKIGVTHESFSRGARAEIDSELRPYSDEERALLMGKLRQFYDRFREVVSKGRGLSMEEVDRVGRGRVWTGAQAHGHRLVDELGGLAEAIAWAKRQAGIPPGAAVELSIVPEPPSNLGRRLARALLDGNAADSTVISSAIERRLAGTIPPSLIEARGQPLARMDYEIRWE